MNELHKLRPTLRAAAFTALSGALAFSAGCKSNNTVAANGQDPADANLAQPYTGGDSGGQAQVMGQSESYTPRTSGQSYEAQSPAPIIRQAPAGAVNNTQYYPVPQAQNAQYSGDQGAYPQGNYTDAEEAGEQALAETDQAPPPLPEYDQPAAPEDDYIWTPGYWNYASTGYYWVPGVWCAPPFYGALWTPPYWGYSSNHYLFHRGYWGPHVGYYGGVNYGFGYIGIGYYGGYWRGHDFFYNRSVTNVNINIVHNVYQHEVIYNNQTYGPHPDNRISYNGGRGGLTVQPRPQEVYAMHEAHYAPVAAQREVRVAAASNRGQFFSANQGRPAQPFAARPVGNVGAIPVAPREQAFNHPGVPNPALNNNRTAEPNRPVAPNQPASANRPAEVSRPATAQPNQPAYNNRPGEPNHPGEFNHPGAPNQPTFNNGRPSAPTQPASNNNRPAAPVQPAPSNNRPGEFNRTPQPNQPRPNLEAQRPSQPQPQPRPQPQPQPQRPATVRPDFQAQRPTQPQPPMRPNVEAQRPAPAIQPRPAAAPQPAPRPQESAPRPAAAAPHVEAPRGGGSEPHGGEKGGNEHH